jgi:hydrogenase maturation factor HypF (carbamoyltransferase family)
MATPTTYAVTTRKGEFRGQCALVYERLRTGPCTIKEIVAHLDAHPKFVTVQTSERIAAYYICVLKKSGHIAPVSTERKPEYTVEMWAAGEELVAPVSE